MAYAYQSDAESVILEMSPTEAGYLSDLLWAHVAGSLTVNGQPLGSIREALDNGGIARVHARRVNVNSHGRDVYGNDQPFAILEPRDNA